MNGNSTLVPFHTDYSRRTMQVVAVVFSLARVPAMQYELVRADMLGFGVVVVVRGCASSG